MRNLSTKGLSMSQEQSISKLCNQRAQNISNKLDLLNNASKIVRIDKVDYIQEEAHKLPDNVVELILEKGALHATQAFLMEAIKAKDKELNVLRNMRFEYDVPMPSRKDLEEPELLDTVEEDWGWKQLSDSEYNEYLQVEALASHIGQFIHKGGKLDTLRSKVNNTPSLEWITIKDGEKTPMKVIKHHTAEQLNEKHEEFAALHRNYEQRVNYFKAKVKNLVTMENARIAKVNADKISEYNALEAQYNAEYQSIFSEWSSARKLAQQTAEVERENLIKDVAALRINIDPRFQPVVDLFLNKSED